MKLWALLLITALSACAHDPVRENVRDLPHPASPRRAFDELRGAPAHAGVTVLSDPALAWSMRWQLLSAADHRVDASYFIVDNDVFGLAFLGHLYSAARRGVAVRLLVDARGTLPLLTSLDDNPLLGELASGKDVEVRIYNPPLQQIGASLVQGSAVPVAAGSHEKILAVDGKFAIAGGRNIGGEYFLTPEEKPSAMADTDVLLTGAASAIELSRIASFPENAEAVDGESSQDRSDELLMLEAAMDAWLRGAVPSKPVADAARALEQVADAALEHPPSASVVDVVEKLLRELVGARSVYGTIPGPELPVQEAPLRIISSQSRAEPIIDDDTNDAMLRAIAGAQHEIMIESPYFLMTPRMLAALEDAGRRGVRIDVLTNGPLSSDNIESQALFIDSWPEIEARVPTLHFWVEADNQMLHAKRAMFDDDLSFIGSYNLDPISAHLNSEIIVAVWSRAVNAQNRGEIEERIDRADVVEYRIKRDARGQPLRYPRGHPHAGEVVVAYGPRDYLARDNIERLESLKHLLFSIRPIFDFQWVVW